MYKSILLIGMLPFMAMAMVNDTPSPEELERSRINYCVGLKDDIYQGMEKALVMQKNLTIFLGEYDNADTQYYRVPAHVDSAEENLKYWDARRTNAMQKIKRIAESGVILGDRIDNMQAIYGKECAGQVFNPELVASVCANPKNTQKSLCTQNKF